MTGNQAIQRVHITICGAVQGVGFRPFIYRLASELQLKGWVLNSAQGVFIEVEGPYERVENFLLRIEPEQPPRSFIQSLESTQLDPLGYTSFEIRQSDEGGTKTTLVLPDSATCPDCLHDISDPANRRYRYPFTNCTNCGPRFSIIEALPYDRPNTTMQGFPMCEDCRAEYENPLDRRFHAQPNACPRCGPQIALWDRRGHIMANGHQALLATADAIRRGAIVAIKGLGGFHLVVDARNDEAVLRLRERKQREEKPFALMYPRIEEASAACEITALEARLMRSAESPIVLLRRRGGDSSVAPSVAPRNPYLGIMLPYTPLHHLLMAELGFPIVATSGNRSDEPICIDEHEALERLGTIVELLLVHNRPIARHVDDSIVRIMLGRELVLRRARGYAPLPVELDDPSEGLLAVGAHLKSTVAIAVEHNVFTSQHIGDLETTQAYDAFQHVIGDLGRLYELHPTAIACDAHPDYRSTQFAQQAACEQQLPLIQVQHHYAHTLACMGENRIAGPALGVSWDGTGYGLDGTIWGGEFLQISERSFLRAAHLRTFRLPGGEQAIKQPRRVALGLLYELFGDALFEMRDLAPVAAFSAQELAILRTMLERGLNAPLTSSAGRLFDAVAALIGLRQIAQFEGQAALELEFALEGVQSTAHYELAIELRDGAAVVDWAALVHGMIDDLHKGVSIGKIAATFHNTLSEAIVAVARRVGEERVVLSGGCFQNQYLTTQTVTRLRAAGFRPYWHQRIPPNDGGIALGQVIAAVRER